MVDQEITDANSSVLPRDSKDVLNKKLGKKSRSLKRKNRPHCSAERSCAKEDVITGKIAFPRHFPYESKVTPFMRATPSVDIMEVLDILERKWNISSPRIVLFIVSNISTPSNWRVNDFVKGLVRAANTTGMWICTNGINMGVVKAIGDAFELETVKQQAKCCSAHTAHRVSLPEFVLLGICQEKYLSNAEKLQEEVPVIELSSMNNQPVEHHKYDLNPSHTHFIIMKSNNRKKCCLNNFVSRLECHLSEALKPDSHESGGILELVTSEIPVVAILIEGGQSCVHFILDHLKKSLPVIVIKGSGGLADLISYAYYEIERRPLGIDDVEYVENVLKPELSSKISHDFENLCYNNLQRLSFCDKILECIMYSQQDESEYLTIVNAVDTSCKLEDLSAYLLRALIKSQKPDTSNWEDQMEKDLYLAMDWNRPEMAVRDVFFKDPSNAFKVKDEVFKKALLRPEREEFVSLFLKHGFKVHKYLTAVKLHDLFKHSLQEEFFHLVCWQGVLGYGVEANITLQFLDYELNILIEALTGLANFMNSQELDLNKLGLYDIGKETPGEDVSAADAERKARTILTIWAVLSKRIVLAKKLWMHSEYPIHLALMSSMILHKLQFFVTEIGEKEEMEKQSREFGKMAIEVLDACYKEMPCRAYDLLSEENPDFAYRTAVDIAAVAENRPFIAHPCCQKWLDHMFMGNIRVRSLTWGDITFPTWLKVILSAIFIFPMYLWVRFKEKGDSFEPTAMLCVMLHLLKKMERQQGLKNIMPKMPRACKLLTWTGDNEIKTDNAHVKLNTSGSCDKLSEKHKSIPLYKKVFWMWSAPITKFWIFQIFYMMYLLLFSLAVLWPSCGNKMLDIAVCSWTATMVIESIHRTYVLYKKFYSIPVLPKCLEIFALLIFIFFYALGRIAGYGMFFDPYGGKILLCCGLLYFYYRLIFIVLPISPTLGPQLYKIKHMVLKDFTNFMRLALLVMVSSAIVLQAVIYPDFQFSAEMFRRVFDRAWISLFLTPADDLGEVDPHCVRWIRRPKNSEVCLAGRYLDESCPNPGLWPYIFGIQYFMFLKVILITLLYALFTNSQSNVLDDSDVIWKFQRYQLVVDFAYRQRLPAPLNVFSYLCILVQCLIRLCWRKHETTEIRKQLSLTQYDYWRQLAYKYARNQEMKEKEEDVLRKQLGKLLELAEDIGLQRKIVYGLKSHLTELQTNVSSTHTYLESFKLDKESEMDASGKKVVQYLSRRSPYPNTKVNRFPVTDKYVPWDCAWLQYDPIAFTLPKADFTRTIRPFVDEDIHAMRELHGEEFTVPVFGWNSVSSSPAGVYLNRQSWITDDVGDPLIYEIDLEDLPRNPMGRTGLRGRGALPRWGPNHHIFLIITRWKRSCSGSPTDQLELVVTHSTRTKELSLPGGFVTHENRYAVMQECFKTDPVDGVWKNSEEMMNFFRLQVVYAEENDREASIAKMSSQLMTLGYLDDPLNTDQAWIEVELWHLHYDVEENIKEILKDKYTEWNLVTEDMLAFLSPGLAMYVRSVIHSLRALVI